MSNAFGIGASGLIGMQKRIDIHSANIANANTPGYRRRDPFGQERANGGVQTDFTHRFNPAVAQRLSAVAGESAKSGAAAQALAQTEGVIGDMASSVKDAQVKLSELMYQASLSPDEPALRELVTQQANVLARQTSEGLSQLDQQAVALGRDMSQVRGQAEQKMDQLASLNREVFRTGGTPELRDRQAQVGRELAELVGGEVRMEQNGTASFMLNNTFLVYSDNKRPLPATPDIKGGKLGGLSEARNETLGLRAEMGAQVQSYVDSINSINQGGLNSAGAPGGQVFDFNGTQMSVVASPGAWSFKSATAGAPSPMQGMADTEGLTPAVTNLAIRAGGLASSAQAVSETQASSLTRLDAQQQAAEGVDIDQEMIAMKVAQRLYEANAKVIQTADSMLGTLLSIKA